MKKLVSFVFLLVCTFHSFAQKQLVVDADAEMRVITGSFDAISVSDAIIVYLSQSDKEEVAVSAKKEKFRNKIKTEVKDNKLKIYYESENGISFKDKKLVVYVSFKSLKKIEASGSSGIIVAGTIKVPDLELALSGSSDFKGTVSLNSLSLDLSGSSDVAINGNATTLVIESSGASDVDGFGLSTEICTASASGASDIHVSVSKELNASATGSSEILYKGEAVIKAMNTSGASTVSRKEG